MEEKQIGDCDLGNGKSHFLTLQIEDFVEPTDAAPNNPPSTAGLIPNPNAIADTIGCVEVALQPESQILSSSFAAATFQKCQLATLPPLTCR